MPLKETLMNDLKAAMKDKDIISKNAIQMARAAVLQVEKDNKTELDDNGVIQVIAKEVKKRKDALPAYEQSGREDLIADIKKEIQVLSKYLPEQLSEDEVKNIVAEIIKELNATSIKDMGSVMKLARERTSGRADGKTINNFAKELLG